MLHRRQLVDIAMLTTSSGIQQSSCQTCTLDEASHEINSFMAGPSVPMTPVEVLCIEMMSIFVGTQQVRSELMMASYHAEVHWQRNSLLVLPTCVSREA